MSYLYEISAGNPEGTDWSRILSHEKEYSEEEFQAICEEALLFALEKQKEKKEVVFIANASEYVIEFLKSKGFTYPKVIYYDIEPYWNMGRIKNKKIIKVIEDNRGY